MARPAAGLAHHYGSRSRTDADSRSRLPSCVYPIALAAPLGRFRLRRTERALREYVASGRGDDPIGSVSRQSRARRSERLTTCCGEVRSIGGFAPDGSGGRPHACAPPLVTREPGTWIRPLGRYPTRTYVDTGLGFYARGGRPPTFAVIRWACAITSLA